MDIFSRGKKLVELCILQNPANNSDCEAGESLRQVQSIEDASKDNKTCDVWPGNKMLLDNPVSNPTTESNIDIILQEEEGNRRENNVQDPECTGLPVVTLWQNDFDSVLLPVPGVEIEFITANFTNTSLAGNLTTEINGTGFEIHDTDPIESVQLLPADETSLEVTRKNANIVASTSHDILQGEENISEEEMLVHQNADTDSDFAPKPPDSPQKGCDPRPKRGRKRKHETSREENKAKRNRNEEHYNNKEFYKALFGAAQVEDDVDGFSGAPDFDVE
ncbi:uncharacterized protein LOC134536524 [Bacillus rossius redtenbacheri]|uniref:uncharacterized protein LOC134536524 n=1 Tax=Bacillus rossius redtenbacheri TaxID=93214 RepID=UPI002FDEB25A